MNHAFQSEDREKKGLMYLFSFIYFIYEYRIYFMQGIVILGTTVGFIWHGVRVKEGHALLVQVYLGIMVALFGLRQVWMNRRIAKASYQWQQIKATHDYCTNFLNLYHEFMRRHAFFNKENERWEWKDFSGAEKDKTFCQDYRRLLNNLEGLACGIKHQLMDGEVAYDLVRGVLDGLFTKGIKFIENAKKMNPRAFEMLVKLAGQWRNRYDKAQKNSYIFFEVPARPSEWKRRS